MAAPEADAGCDRCGPLGWTVERYGAIAHKHGCPHNPNLYCQAHPVGCAIGGDQRELRVGHLERIEADRAEAAERAPAGRYDDPACQQAFERGWDDARFGRSDFVRRSYKHESGERAAYMAGRYEYHRAERPA